MDCITYASPIEIISYIQNLGPECRFSLKFKLIGLKETKWYPLVTKISIKEDFLELSSEQYKNTLKFNYKILEYIIIRIYDRYIKKEDMMLMVDRDYHIPLFSEQYFKELLPQKIYDEDNI
ncbi:MAG: hypothetical protein ACFWUA_06160 [Sporanaerobacter sp.]|uniref:hypothetical protein n=1 Tax=Sporanaerobacter sp. TaxID=2010183 RepID=UPI003A102321